MDISPRCRIDEVRAATDHARQLFAGRIRRNHEFAKEHAAARWAFVRITVEPYVRSAAHSPCGGLVAAIAPIILTRGGGQRAHWYSLLPNPVVKHSRFSFYRESDASAIVPVHSVAFPARPTHLKRKRGPNMNERGVGWISWPSQRPGRSALLRRVHLLLQLPQSVLVRHKQRRRPTGLDPPT